MDLFLKNKKNEIAIKKKIICPDNGLIPGDCLTDDTELDIPIGIFFFLESFFGLSPTNEKM